MDVWVVEYLYCISVTCDSNFIAYANASLLLSLPMWHLWSDFIIFKNVFYTFYHHEIWLIWEECNTHDFFFLIIIFLINVLIWAFWFSFLIQNCFPAECFCRRDFSFTHTESRWLVILDLWIFFICICAS